MYVCVHVCLSRSLISRQIHPNLSLCSSFVCVCVCIACMHLRACMYACILSVCMYACILSVCTYACMLCVCMYELVVEIVIRIFTSG